MKFLLLLALIPCALFFSCKCAQKTGPKTDTASTNNASANSTITGTWQLTYITGPRIAFDGLYPDKKPVLTFDATSGKVTGNSSCNSISGPVTIKEQSVSFGDFISTKMACQGEGEQVFLQTLKKINKFDITDGNTLHLIMGDVAMMRFTKMP